ncbi:hypothetical protein EHS25_000224 [Saitozyma podzolica]|uniref:Uncharacterized protein n=1 Tax=Saitozyma podzolica TaxID=1890683 RepID=A0A427YVH2_9TREE|nr:hypothetical protein EHS25_000224 [Saitozyma podzolica]
MALPPLLQYDAPCALYGIAFSHSPRHPHRTVLSSAITGPSNRLLVVDLASNLPSTQSAYTPQSDFQQLAQAPLAFPATKSKSPATSLPPITSFSWNATSPNSIVTCSIDTTATLWDINTSQALTQLIAHDRAVYDLSWLPDSSDIFVSVGADGSLRAFDLRTLEHSTILYESSGETPLARIAFSNREQHMLACFGMDESKALILDMRSPGHPVAELLGHQAPLGAISWGSGGDVPGTSGGGWIATCGDDSQLLLYDLTSPLPEARPASTRPSTRPSTTSRSGISPNSYALSPPSTPSQARSSPSPAHAAEIMPVKGWTADAEINNLAFTNSGEWVGCVSGQRMSVLKV